MELGQPEVDEFLSWLAVRRHVAPRTQAIALNAIMFLYRQFLDIDLGKLQFSVRALNVEYRKSFLITRQC